MIAKARDKAEPVVRGKRDGPGHDADPCQKTEAGSGPEKTHDGIDQRPAHPRTGQDGERDSPRRDGQVRQRGVISGLAWAHRVRRLWVWLAV